MQLLWLGLVRDASIGSPHLGALLAAQWRRTTNYGCDKELAVNMTLRRTRILRLDANVALRLFKKLKWGIMYEAIDLPDDLRVVGMAMAHRPNVVLLEVESQSFGTVSDGVMPPDWHPNFTTYSPVELPNGDLLFDAELSGRRKAVVDNKDA
jgi:hypothetical protein